MIRVYFPSIEKIITIIKYCCTIYNPLFIELAATNSTGNTYLRCIYS